MEIVYQGTAGHMDDKEFNFWEEHTHPLVILAKHIFVLCFVVHLNVSFLQVAYTYSYYYVLGNSISNRVFGRGFSYLLKRFAWNSSKIFF